MAFCAFDGCGRTVRSNGLCATHYEHQRAGKTLRPLQVQHHGLTEYERFLKLAVVGTSKECWSWSASRQLSGAGKNRKLWHGQWRNADGDIELAHRAAWRLMKGPIPGRLFVLHRCDNPICVNPTHLFLGSQSDNLKDMWAKGRARPGTSVGEKHGMSKLTAEAVREIRTSELNGKELAAKFGVSATTICDVQKRRIWKHIP